MTTTVVKDSIVGDAWLQQTAQNVPIQKIIDPQTGNWNGDFLTGPVRLSWCDSLDKLPAPTPDKQNPKHGASLLFTPYADFALLYEEYYRLCALHFPEYYQAPQPGFEGGYIGLQSPFHNQAEKLKYSGYTPGCMYLTCTSKFKPPVVDSRFNPIVNIAEKAYAGAWAICAIKAYDYGKNPPKPKKGIAFGLQSVMLIGDDTKLAGGGPDVAKQMASLAGKISGPVVRPGIGAGMPIGGQPPQAGIPGYGAPQGTPVTNIPQSHYTPPGAPAAPAYDAATDPDLQF